MTASTVLEPVASGSSAAPTARPTASGRIPELDGLRGAAILFVWLGHYFDLRGQGFFRVLDYSVFRMGWSGVDLFFVLSGFLIGGILLDARESRSYFRTFYMRRFFRIIPVYYAWIAAYIAMVTVGGSFLRAHAHTGVVEGVDFVILAQFLFLQNFGDFLASPISYWWFTATWSLAVEEQFYLVSPLLIRFLSRRRLTVFLGAVVAGAPLIRLFIRHQFANGMWLGYRLMPARADALAFGMLAAVAWRTPAFREWLSAHARFLYSAFAALLAGFLALWKWFPNPQQLLTQTVGYTWLALFYTVILLLALARPSGPIAAISRLGFLRDLGRISYCVYIIHAAVYLLTIQVFLHDMPKVTNLRSTAVTLLAAAITYTIAKVSWRFLEEPLLRRGHAFKY